MQNSNLEEETHEPLQQEGFALLARPLAVMMVLGHTMLFFTARAPLLAEPWVSLAIACGALLAFRPGRQPRTAAGLMLTSIGFIEAMNVLEQLNAMPG